ncbi:suppressor of fused domain protein [Amycolatopsis sp. NPDC059657]|uniref:suppressor of fused domain protein n=1 Tax=Amycolatopsis sp. NPDC059657 TaxID=3346899 RepID=UPI00366ABEE8
MTDVDEAPGWDAIDAVLAALYPGIEPHHVGYHPPRGFVGGALQGCSAYPAEGHWHYVTYGLSELYQPQSEDDPEWSGWGFELTLRVPRKPDDDQAPGWPFAMLQELAKYVNNNQVLLKPGHRIDLRQPITGHPHLPDAPATELTVYALTMDPQLGQIGTPNGDLIFLQVVGVTADEKETMLASTTADILAKLAERNPLLVTYPDRRAATP